MHFRISRTMDAEDIFRCSIGCEIMLMIKARIRLIFQGISRSCSVFNSLTASDDFCHLLITFTNSLDPDQAQQNVGPDLDQNCLTT